MIVAEVPVLENIDSIKPSLVVEKFQEYSRFFNYYVNEVKGSGKYKHIAEKVPSFFFNYFEKLIQQVQRVYVEDNN